MRIERAPVSRHACSQTAELVGAEPVPANGLIHGSRLVRVSAVQQCPKQGHCPRRAGLGEAAAAQEREPSVTDAKPRLTTLSDPLIAAREFVEELSNWDRGLGGLCVAHRCATSMQLSEIAQ